MRKSPTVEWNDQLRLALSDVDETIADVYKPAEPAMIEELSFFINEGRKLFLVTGTSLQRTRSGITDLIAPALRRDILVSHCSGAEVWGFTETGELRDKPFFSAYEEVFTPELKKRWRETIAQLLEEFELRPHHVRPKLEFFESIGRHPLDIMYDDRGPQITFELVNAYDLSDVQMEQIKHEVPLTHGQRDLRIPILERAEQLFKEAGIPITPRLGGTCALDFAVEGVSKATSIRRVLEDVKVLSTIGLTASDLADPASMEVWGDKFSTIRGASDWHMSEALPPQVRSLDFREEDPAEFLPGYNTVLWDGEQHLHHGLLEYLQSRRKR